MKVRVIRSFAGVVNGQSYSVSAGQEIELPEGVDWIKAGLVVPLVVPIREDEQEVAVVEAPEAAVVEKPRVTRRKPPKKAST